MVWLDIAEENGSGFYLDIRGIEPRRVRGNAVFAVSGVLGDGRDEVEVLVEVGHEVEVLFVDEWLRKGLGGLFARVNREELVSALAESITGISFCIEGLPALEGRPWQRVGGYRSRPSRTLPSQCHAGQMDLPLVV